MEHKSFYKIFRHEGLAFGWKTAKKDIFFFLKIFLIIIAVTHFLPTLIDMLLNISPDSVTPGDALSSVFGMIFSFGLIKIYLHFVHNRTAHIKDLIFTKEDGKTLVNWVLAKFGSQILIFLGFILLIIPGIYIAARFYFVELMVVDKKMRAIDAMRASRKLTK